MYDGVVSLLAAMVREGIVETLKKRARNGLSRWLWRAIYIYVPCYARAACLPVLGQPDRFTSLPHAHAKLLAAGSPHHAGIYGKTFNEMTRAGSIRVTHARAAARTRVGGRKKTWSRILDALCSLKLRRLPGDLGWVGASGSRHRHVMSLIYGGSFARAGSGCRAAGTLQQQQQRAGNGGKTLR